MYAEIHATKQVQIDNGVHAITASEYGFKARTFGLRNTIREFRFDSRLRELLNCSLM